MPDGGLLTRRELADELDVNRQTVTKWKARGAPVAEPGRPGKPDLYDPEAITAWRKRVEEEKKSDEHIDLTAERARKERAQAMLAEQKFLEQAGELVRAADVEERWASHISAARAKLMALAKQPKFAAVRDELEREIRDVLIELSGGELEGDDPEPTICGAPTKAGTPCRNAPGDDGWCHIPSHGENGE